MVTDSDPVNWLFLAELIVVVIVASAFLFYWNRLLGSSCAFFIRLVTWRLFNAYIIIGSLQVSPLAGRIAFRDVEYISSNISVRALHGTITFRYWIFRVRHEGDSSVINGKRARLPCRLIISAEGVEAFFYNRTPAYDAIVERMKKHEQANKKDKKKKREDVVDIDGSAKPTPMGSGSRGRQGLRQRQTGMGEVDGENGTLEGNEVTGDEGMTRESSNAQSSDPSSSDHLYPPKPKSTHNPTTTGHDLPYGPKLSPDLSAAMEEAGVNWLREALPMELKIVTGSVVLGSDATPMVLIGDFKRAEGVVEINESRSPCDKYKLSVNVGFTDVTMLMRTNVDYSGPLLAHGKKTYDELIRRQPDLTKNPPSTISTFSGFHFLAKRYPFLFDPKFSSPPVPGLPQNRVWKGLARYRLNNDSDGVKQPAREEREYAKVTTLLKTRGVELTYYADTPGLVPDPLDATVVDPKDELGNVEPPPEYGIDIVLHGGAVNYGPWSDRQRDALQKAFSPSIFFDSEPRPRLKKGDIRLHTLLTVNISMTERTTLRIPTREPSKDWMYTDHQTERRYGWLDVVVGASSSVTYTQSQFATKHGYESMLVLHLDSLDLASSVNLQSFVTAKACRLSMTMPTPLQWDAQRDWGIDVTLDTPDIVLLRDHVTLISDLAKDWSSGALGDFHHFIPNKYNFRVSLNNYSFHLFINDFNIVDAPQSREDNAFLDVTGTRMDAYVAVAATKYRAELSVIPFTIEATDAKVGLPIPRWDTHYSFRDKDSTPEVGKIGFITVSGSYRYYSSPRPDHQETLNLHISAEKVGFVMMGWVLRRMFSVKDNYFGAFTQYSTMSEYLEKFDTDPKSVGDPIEEKYRPGRSDPFAVQVSIDVRDSIILASDEIYGQTQGVAMPVPQFQMALSSNQYRMELSLNALPTYLIASNDIKKCYNEITPPTIDSNDVAFIEGIDVKANRLFGPQPRSTTYFCLWEVAIPRVSAFISPKFWTTLQGVGRSFAYNFQDPENSPSSIYLQPSSPDATFFKLAIDHVSVLVSAGDVGLSIDLKQGLSLDTSSIATNSFGSSSGFAVPSISAHILAQNQTKTTTLSNRGRHAWLSIGSAHTGIAIDTYKAPKGWREKAVAQQAFLKEQDSKTKRVRFLYGDPDEPDVWGKHVYDVYVPQPSLPLDYPDVEEKNQKEMVDQDDEKFTSSPESSESDDDVGLGQKQKFRRPPPLHRKSTFFATAPDTDSTIDESDTVSSVMTSSAESEITTHAEHMSMAQILYQRLKLFSFGDSPEFEPWHDDDDDEGDEGMSIPSSTPRAEFGMINRITVRQIIFEFSPETVKAVAQIFNGFKEQSVRPEVQLDALLVTHTMAVLTDKRDQGSVIFDVQIPSIIGTVGVKDSPVVRFTGEGVGLRTVSSQLDRGDSTLNLSMMIRSLEVIGNSARLPKNDITLLDVENRAFDIAPLIKVNASGIGFRMSKKVKNFIVQVKTENCDVDLVTASGPLVSDLVDMWSGITNVFNNNSLKVSVAETLWNILKESTRNDQLSSQPVFVFEGAYGLHLGDQRNIRRDLGWLALARFRHWLRILPAESSISSPPTPKAEGIAWNKVELGRAVVRDLCKLDDFMASDEPFMSRQRWCQDAFGIIFPLSDEEQRAEAGGGGGGENVDTFGVFTKIGQVCVRHHGRLLGSGGKVKATMIKLGTASIGLQDSTTTQRGNMSVNGGRVGFGDTLMRTTTATSREVRALVALQEFKVELENGILPAVQMALDLQKQRQTVPVVESVSTEISSRRPTTRVQIVRAHDGEGETNGDEGITSSTQTRSDFAIIVDTQIGVASISVAAGGLRLKATAQGGQGSGAVRIGSKIIDDDNDEKQNPKQKEKSNRRDFVTVTCEGLDVVLVKEENNHNDDLERVLVASSLRSLKCLVDSRGRDGCRLLFNLGNFSFESRLQLKSFFDFGQDWRKNHYELYRPFVEMLKSQAESQPSSRHPPMPGILPVSQDSSTTTKASTKTKALPLTSLSVDIRLGSARIHIRAAKSLWVGWDVGQVYATRQGTDSHIRFGMRIDPQLVGAYTSAQRTKSRDSSTIRLPSFTAIGSHIVDHNNSQSVLTARINLGLFTGVLKPAVFDRLLSLHQKMGADAIEVFKEYQHGIKKGLSTSSSLRSREMSSASAEPILTGILPPKPKLFFDVEGKVAGIRVGLRADDVPTTLQFEALDLVGSATNSFNSITHSQNLQWHVKASHVGLSLGQLGNSLLAQQHSKPVRKSRSASMVVDIDAKEIPATEHSPSQLSIKLSHVHTVMHISALSEMADLIRSWSSDLALLKEARAAEVAEVREQTTKVLKKLEPGESPESWFASRLVAIEATGFGIAIPLEATNDVGRKNEPKPALLYSIRFMSFTSRRGETARFKVQQMVLQFVDTFDQSVAEHFAGDLNESSNQMSLPSIDSEAQMSSHPDSWTLSAHCSATDFKLSLTPDIADGVFTLIDLYEQGKKQMFQMEKDYLAEWAKHDHPDSIAIKYEGPAPPSIATSDRRPRRVIIRSSFTFNSGLVEFRHSTENKKVPNDIRGRPSRSDWHDTFTLPTVSAWMEYVGPNENENAVLLFNSAVHESHNTLRPTILPFFVQIVNRIETRVKKRVTSVPIPIDRKIELIALPVTETALEAIAEAPTGKLNLRITLRIDRSELRFSCAPDSNAYVDLRWDSGGFVASTLLGGEDTTTLAGTVSGVTAYLSHEFADQGRGCIEAGAKDMAFSIALCTSQGKDSYHRGLSIVFDSQMAAKFKLEALSAWLIFIAVWVENAPKLDIPLRAGVVDTNATPSTTTASAAAAANIAPDTNVPSHSPSKLSVAALVRLRTVEFDASIAVSRAHLEMTPIVLRTLSNGEKTEIDLNIGVIQVVARGDISGDVRSDGITFNTIRRSARATTVEADDSTVLRMSIEGGDLYGNLFIGDVNIVRFQLEPVKVTLADDWAEYAADPTAQVFFAFVAHAGQFYGVLRLPAIPRLLGHFYSFFDTVETQNRIAAQRSDMVKAMKLRKAEEPSAPAVVIIKTSDRTDQVKTAQTMRFDFDGIDVGIFADDYEDGTVAEFYRFVVGKVEADLKRRLTKADLPQRALGLMVDLVRWEISDGRKAVRIERRDISASDLITRAMRNGQKVVAYLPSLTLKMDSIQYPSPATIDFDFELVWGDTDGDFQFMPNFFEAAYKSFRRLLKGIDDQRLARARRQGVGSTPLSPRKSRRPSADEATVKKEAQEAKDGLVFRRRGAIPKAIPVPKLKILGDVTGDAAMLVPKFHEAVKELPSLSHKFVTLPLEQGMDLLLKLYEKQLPDRKDPSQPKSGSKSDNRKDGLVYEKEVVTERKDYDVKSPNKEKRHLRPT